MIIYHAGCPDGFTAAWAARLKLRWWEDEMYPATFGQDPPDVTGKDVVIVDFSYPRDALLKMYEQAQTLRVLDHHKTAQADLEGLDFCTFDMERSGAGLAWDELGDDRPRPWLIDYVEDRDLWRHALPDSKAVAAYVMSHAYTIEEWDSMHARAFSDVVEGGKAILKKIDSYCVQMDEIGTYIVPLFEGHENVPVINAPQIMISDLLHFVCDKYNGIAVSWWVRKDGMYQYSLRSIGDIDVSEIAKKYGGGGHRNAAGFQRETRIL